MSISHIFEPVSRQKINLGRKPPATSASGKPVKCTFGCHSQFGISNFSFYILERSITTEMNQYSGDADLLALQILCLFIASGFYRKLLSIFFIFSALGKKKNVHYSLSWFFWAIYKGVLWVWLFLHSWVCPTRGRWHYRVLRPSS